MIDFEMLINIPQDIHWKGIVVSFFAYLFVHSGRKAFTNTKSVAIENLGMSATMAGALDATFMLAYAFGLIMLGGLGDKKSPLRLLGLSLLAMAALQLIFSELCYAGYASVVSGQVAIFSVWIINGIVQALAWPCCVKIVHSCMNGQTHGTIFSVWACNGIAGNVTCSIIASIVMDGHAMTQGFRDVFTVTSICNVLITLVVVRLGRPAPQRLPNPDSDSVELVASGEEGLSPVSPVIAQAMTLEDCLKTRGVIDYSLCHVCIKAVAYGMFFWLPFYLVTVHGVSPGGAASISIAYDVATILGGPVCGYLVDVTKRPATVIAIFSLLAAGPQLMINSATPHVVLSGSVRRLTEPTGSSIPAVVIGTIIASGFLVGGVTNVLSSAVCAKIGGHGSTSRVTGVIDGIGSLGASATQILIPLIGTGKGWDTVFALLAGLLVASAVTLVRIIRDEFN